MKPRGYQKLKEARQGFFPAAFRGRAAMSAPRFRTSGLQDYENKFLLFQATPFGTIFHGSHRKLIQAAGETTFESSEGGKREFVPLPVSQNATCSPQGVQ